MEKLSPYTALRIAAERETIRLRKGKGRLGKVGHAFNPSKVPGQPGTHTEIVSEQSFLFV